MSAREQRSAAAMFGTMTVANVWFEAWCAKCFQPDEAALRVQGKGAGCPIRRALLAGAAPPEIRRSPRATATTEKRWKYSEFTARPPLARPRRTRRPAPDDLMLLLDVPASVDYSLVPVEGWKDYRDEARRGGDEHA